MFDFLFNLSLGIALAIQWHNRPWRYNWGESPHD